MYDVDMEILTNNYADMEWNGKKKKTFASVLL